jgi:hypothetical protein
VLVERIGRNGHLDPFAAAGNDRQHRRPRGRDPHIVLQLSHMLFRSRFLRKRPGQHEFGLKHRTSALDHAVQCRRHPALHRMKHLPLHLGDNVAGISLVPVPVEMLGHYSELDNEIVRPSRGCDNFALAYDKVRPTSTD